MVANENSILKKPKNDRIYDFDYSIRYFRWLLRILGIWQLVVTQPMRFKRYLSTLIIPFVSISMMTLTLPMCCHVILQPIDHFETIILLGPITFQIASIIMHFVLLIRSCSLKICVQHMEQDWKEEKNQQEYDIMKEHVRFSHISTVFCISFMYASAIGYDLVLPLMSGNTINEKNETIRPRAMPGPEIFFDVQADVVYEFVFTINFFSALLHHTVTAAVCILAIVLVSHACGQIQIVIWKLENFLAQITDKNDFTDEIELRLKIIVEKHVRLIKFAANVEEALKEIFLMVVVASALIICFIEYTIMIIWDNNSSDFLGALTYIVLLIAFALNLFLFCRFGEVLKEQSQKIGTAAYMVDWYQLPGTSNKLAFMMIIHMADSPCELTAGGMMELSIASFASIIKASLAYFNMLRTMG